MAGTSHIIPELDRNGLRRFGLTTGLIVALLFGLLLPWLFGYSWPRWPWILFAVLAVMGLVAPMSLNPVYKVWMRFGLLASKVMTPLVLSITYFLVLTPTSILRRLFASDPLRRNLEDDASTYRIQSRVRDRKNLERPF